MINWKFSVEDVACPVDDIKATSCYTFLMDCEQVQAIQAFEPTVYLKKPENVSGYQWVVRANGAKLRSPRRHRGLMQTGMWA